MVNVLKINCVPLPVGAFGTGQQLCGPKRPAGGAANVGGRGTAGGGRQAAVPVSHHDARLRIRRHKGIWRVTTGGYGDVLLL